MKTPRSFPNEGQRRADTLVSALAVVDDIGFLRSTLTAENPTPGDVRRTTSVLRRLLVERQLERVSIPRIGHPLIRGPNLKAVEVANRSRPFQLFTSNCATIFGIEFGGGFWSAGPQPTDLQRDLDSTVDLKPENYLRQGVICVEGQWISRRALLKYVANVADGVHHGVAVDAEERLIARVRHALSYSLEWVEPPYVPEADWMTILNINPEAFSLINLPVVLHRERVDTVLVEMMAISTDLCRSPDVRRLEKYVAEEVP